MGSDRIINVLRTIELLRAEQQYMIEAAGSLTDEAVLVKSQELDKLLNEYYRLLETKNCEQG
ncbi:MAG: Spo0E family sporulation regulatory protein-aspartic acid phosphatase [Bacillota bacterium]